MRGEVSGLTTWLVPQERDRPSTTPLRSFNAKRTFDIYGRSNPDPAAGAPQEVYQPAMNDSILDLNNSMQSACTNSWDIEFNPRTYYEPTQTIALKHHMRQQQEQQRLQNVGMKSRPRVVEPIPLKKPSDSASRLDKVLRTTALESRDLPRRFHRIFSHSSSSGSGNGRKESRTVKKLLEAVSTVTLIDSPVRHQTLAKFSKTMPEVGIRDTEQERVPKSDSEDLLMFESAAGKAVSLMIDDAILDLERTEVEKVQERNTAAALKAANMLETALLKVDTAYAEEVAAREATRLKAEREKAEARAKAEADEEEAARLRAELDAARAEALIIGTLRAAALAVAESEVALIVTKAIADNKALAEEEEIAKREAEVLEKAAAARAKAEIEARKRAKAAKEAADKARAEAEALELQRQAEAEKKSEEARLRAEKEAAENAEAERKAEEARLIAAKDAADEEACRRVETEAAEKAEAERKAEEARLIAEKEAADEEARQRAEKDAAETTEAEKEATAAADVEAAAAQEAVAAAAAAVQAADAAEAEAAARGEETRQRTAAEAVAAEAAAAAATAAAAKVVVEQAAATIVGEVAKEDREAAAAAAAAETAATAEAAVKAKETGQKNTAAAEEAATAREADVAKEEIAVETAAITEGEKRLEEELQRTQAENALIRAQLADEQCKIDETVREQLQQRENEAREAIEEEIQLRSALSKTSAKKKRFQDDTEYTAAWAIATSGSISTFDGTYDGDSQSAMSDTASVASDASNAFVYEVGDKVVAKFRNDDEWLFGTIERVNGDPPKSYNIAYDEKDKMEFGVLSQRIRKAPDDALKLGPEQQDQIKREIADIEVEEMKQQKKLDKHREKMEKLKKEKAKLRKRIQEDFEQPLCAAEAPMESMEDVNMTAKVATTPKAMVTSDEIRHHKMNISRSMSSLVTPEALNSKKGVLKRQLTINDRSNFKASTPTRSSAKVFKFKLELQRQVEKDFDPKDPSTLIPANMTRKKPPLGEGRKATVNRFALGEQQTIFEEGTDVEAMFRGRDNNWMPATVIRCNNNGHKLSYNVEYEDAGKKEFGVPPHFVRRVDDKESARSSLAGLESVAGAPDEVAVKEFARFPSQEDLVIFKREYEALKTLNKIDSPHLVKMLSASLPDTSPPAICLELCDMGNLDTLLKKDTSVPPCERLELVLGVAKGLEAMHSAGWAHLDLKEHNVMVCHSMNEAAEQSRRPRLLAKLCDFGSALYLPKPAVLKLPEDGMGNRYGCGTAGWAAPELLSTLEGNSPVVGVSADIFSFAMIMWRSLVMDVRLPSTTSESPRHHLENPMQGIVGKVAIDRLEAGVRPKWPDHSPDPSVEELGYLLGNLWATDPATRPAAASTLPTLTKLLMGSSRWAMQDEAGNEGYETPRDATGKKEHHVSHSKSRSRAIPQYSTPKLVVRNEDDEIAHRALSIFNQH